MAEENPSPEKTRRSLPGFAQVLMPRSMGIKVGMLLAFTIMVIGGFVGYVLYARGTFEETQRLRLITDNAEGINVGTDLMFSGFPIGRVRAIRLQEDGKVRINVRVPVSEAKWLRTSTIFIIDVPIVGAARLRAFTGNLQDPPLEDRAERPVLRGDTAQEIPRMVATLRTTLENIEQMTASGGALQASLGNVRTATERLGGKHGALGAALGSDEDAQKVVAAIERTNKLLDSLSGASRQLESVLTKADSLAARADGLAAKADQRLFGADGVMDGTQRAVTQTNQILGEVRDSLKKADQLLADAQATSGNVKAATTDLGVLRAEVEATLRRVSGLIEEVNRKWPFQRESEIKLP
jgi:phospholipid/cholesterol/gamma-HCH transport system substrate-binding protein